MGRHVLLISAALGLAATSACDTVFDFGDSHPADGGSVDAPPDLPADVALVCVRDAFTGAAGDDDDGDSLPNGSDSCPITKDPRAEDHNEDGDCRGDLCDLCPQTAMPTGDRDGDGIGDACDYRDNPDVATFDGFINADEFINAGGWQITNDLDHYQSPAGGTQSSYRNTETKQNGVFETLIEIPSAATFDAGLLFSIVNSNTGGDGDAVTVGRTTGGQYELRLSRISSGSITHVNQHPAGLLVPGSQYVLRVQVDITNVQVKLDGNGVSVGWMAMLASPMPTSSLYGLFTTTTTRFAYLFRVAPM